MGIGRSRCNDFIFPKSRCSKRDRRLSVGEAPAPALSNMLHGSACLTSSRPRDGALFLYGLVAVSRAARSKPQRSTPPTVIRSADKTDQTEHATDTGSFHAVGPSRGHAALPGPFIVNPTKDSPTELANKSGEHRQHDDDSPPFRKPPHENHRPNDQKKGKMAYFFSPALLFPGYLLGLLVFFLVIARSCRLSRDLPAADRLSAG